MTKRVLRKHCLERRRFTRCLNDPQLDIQARLYADTQDEALLPGLYNLCKAELEAWVKSLAPVHRILADDATIECAIMDFLEKMHGTLGSLYDPTEVLHLCAYEQNRRTPFIPEGVYREQRKLSKLTPIQITAIIRDVFVEAPKELQPMILYGVRHKKQLLIMIQDMPKHRQLVIQLYVFRIEKKIIKKELPLNKPRGGANSSLVLGLDLAAIESIDPALLTILMLLEDWQAFTKLLSLTQGRTIKMPSEKQVKALLKQTEQIADVIKKKTKMSTKQRKTFLGIAKDSQVLNQYLKESVSGIFRQYDKLYSVILSNLEKSSSEEVLKVYKKLSVDLEAQINTLYKLTDIIGE